MVNGFSAGEYNRIGNNWTVRKYHAHSWVEAWFPPYGWIEFDPTPARVASPRSSLAKLFSNLTDTIGLWWWESIVNYDSSKQYHVVNGLLSGLDTIQNNVSAFFASIKLKGQKAVAALQAPARIPELNKKLILSLPLLIILGALLFRPVRRRLFHRIRHFRHRNNSQSAAISFYAEALDLLEAHGLRRQQDQTPMEFAQSLGRHPAASAFLSLTQIYNVARFGEVDASFTSSEAQTLLYSLHQSVKSQRIPPDHHLDPSESSTN
jgi:hypothetical protein